MPPSPLRSRTTAVLAAAALVVVGAAGGGYAAAQITGKDIKDGTVTSADVKDGTLTRADVKDNSLTGTDVKDGTLDAQDFSELGAQELAPRLVVSTKGPGTYLADGGGLTLMHSMSLPSGSWLVTVNATAFPGNGSGDPYVDCILAAQGNGSAGTTASIAGGNFYTHLGAQLAVISFDTEVTFSCVGNNAGVNRVAFTAVEVGQITDLSPLGRPSTGR